MVGLFSDLGFTGTYYGSGSSVPGNSPFDEILLEDGESLLLEGGGVILLE